MADFESQPLVWIPPLLQDLTQGLASVRVAGNNVRQIIEGLDQLFPGIKARLCVGDQLKPGVAVVVDSLVANLGLRQPVKPTSEVHFVAAISGGA